MDRWRVARSCWECWQLSFEAGGRAGVPCTGWLAPPITIIHQILYNEHKYSSLPLGLSRLVPLVPTTVFDIFPVHLHFSKPTMKAFTVIFSLLVAAASTGFAAPAAAPEAVADAQVEPLCITFASGYCEYWRERMEMANNG